MVNLIVLARTHEVYAFGALLTAMVYVAPSEIGWVTLLAVMVANLVGALLPDIDQASNRLWDMLPGGNLIGKVLKNLFLSHRTITHSILGVVLVYKGLEWLTPRILNPSFVDTNLVIMAVMIGYLSHLALDGLTEEGLPLLFPIKEKFGFPPIKSWRIKTGKWFENWVIFPLGIGYLVWLLADWAKNWI